MKNLETELLKLKNDFNTLKKKIEKLHLIFILIYFSSVALTILLFQKYLVILYNNFLIKIMLFSLMILGLIIHYLLRYKFYKSKNCYKSFFNKSLEKIKINFPKNKNFNKSIVDYIKENLKKEEHEISKADLYKFNFWGLLIKYLDINPDEII